MRETVVAACLVLVGPVGFAVSAATLYAAAQALETRASIPELPAPSVSLAEMWPKAPVVVVGTVTESGPLVVPDAVGLRCQARVGSDTN